MLNIRDSEQKKKGDYIFKKFLNKRLNYIQFVKR